MEENSDNEKLDAFGFTTDDEAVELVAGEYIRKLPTNPASSLLLEPVSNEANFQLRHMDGIDSQANDFSDDGDSSCPSSPSSSDLGENEGYLGDPASHSFSAGLQLEPMDVVVVSPDYITFGDKYCTDSSLIFSSSGVKLEGTNTLGDKECFRSEWSICDVTHIESKWCDMVETALVKLRLREAAVVGDSHGPPDVVELNFAIYDDRWAQKQEKILSLNARYRAVWYELTGNGMARLEGDHMGQNSTFSLERYLREKHFDEVIYPKGDPDAVSISKRDVELLHPETFINDTLIDFYIKYLKDKIQPEDQHRFHFFNSFFFRKLADLDKDPSSASEGRAAFLRVRKWTRKVNLFGKDYIFIPVNFNLHWSLIVLCNLGEVAKSKGEETDDSHKMPCILHMDSIKGSHKGLQNLIQSYLWEEWKERHAESSADLSSKFLNLRFINLELPQQENSFDCGLFLLHYVECFLEDAPNSFSPLNISKSSNFLNINWFPPSEASLKRARMKKLIQKLVDDHSPVTPEAASSDGLAFLSGRSSLSGIGDSNSFLPTVEPGIEMNLLERSSKNEAQLGRDQGSVYREYFESGGTAETFPPEQYPAFDQHSLPHTSKYGMSPIEEGEESQEGITSLSGAAGGWETGELAFETCSTSYVPKNVGEAEPLCNIGGFSMNLEEHNDNSIPPAASFGYQDSSELRFDVLSLTRDFASQNQQEQTEEANASRESVYGSRPIDRTDNFLVLGSQGMERNTDVFENEGFLSCKDNSPAAMSPEENNFFSEERNSPEDDLQLNGDDGRSGLSKDHHDVQLIEEDLKSELGEHNHIAKRPRLMLSGED
ncbi:hypothetical protein MKW94_005281 [Papaver nudicaule]|uniref:Ubiquitin-like protease family profile domain-containing protein n=1 Tax=Papaver nudicaule TaxID=74823 RepID=A0AA41RLT8_PAPNU|nr:hypothetical protein [Papaver nudicaule]